MRRQSVRRLGLTALAMGSILMGTVSASHFRFGNVSWRLLPPLAPPTGVPTSVTFEFDHANCGSGANSFEFFINGTSIAVEDHSFQNCFCDQVLSFTYTDPTILALLGPVGTNTVSMTAQFSSNLYQGATEARVDYTTGGEVATLLTPVQNTGCTKPLQFFGSGTSTFGPATLGVDQGGPAIEVTVLEGWRSSFISTGFYTIRNSSGAVVGNMSAGGPGGVIASGSDVAGEGWVLTRAVRVFSLAPGDLYTIEFQSCCRIGSLINASNNSMRIAAEIDLRGGNTGSPVSSLPVILQMAQGQLNQVPLPIADPDGDPFTCRLASSSESLISSVPSAGGNTLSIASGCLLTWDTTGTSVGQKYAAQVMIEENSAGGAGQVPLDFIIEIVGGTANQPPTCSSQDVSPGGTLTASVGQPLTVTVTGTDPDGDALTVSDLSLPAGATLTPPGGSTGSSPFDVTFSWTPTAADAGTVRAVTILFTDPGGLQAICSFAIDIPANSPPTCSIQSAPSVATVGVAYMAEILVDDPDGDDVSISVSGLPGTVDLTPSDQAAPYLSALSWTPSAADAGQQFTVTVTVDDGSAQHVCSFDIDAVNQPPQAVCNVYAASGATPNSPGVFECETASGTDVVFDGSGSSDPDGDQLLYTWIVAGTSYDATGTGGVLTLTIPAGVGATSAVLVVQDLDSAGDPIGGVDDCTDSVAVEDTTPPTLRCTVSEGMLWPPNHKMQTIDLTVEGMDACTSPQDIVITAIEVWSDELDNGTGVGDGDTIGDIDGLPGYWDPVSGAGDGPVLIAIPAYDSGTGSFPTSFDLRAERDGTLDGRCYTIKVSAIDDAGNLAESTCCIFVPHDMGKGKN